MGVVSIVSLAASISAMTFAGPRVYYAMARDGLFFAPPARCTRRTARRRCRSSRRACGAVARAVGRGDALTTYTGFAIMLFPGSRWWRCSCCAGGSPTRRGPSARGATRWLRRIFAVASLLIVVNALWTDLVGPLLAGAPLGPSAAGLLMIALGLPLFAWFTRSAAPVRGAG